MRSIVFAYQEVGYVCLETLLGLGAEVVAVFTHDDDPDEHIWFRSVRELASRHDLPVFAPQRVAEDWLPRLRAWSPDFLLSFYYRRLLSAGVLAVPRLAALNLHGSLLPKYRGRCPVNWVLVNGERETGVTLHHMEKTADAGDIVAQHRIAIEVDDTAATLNRRVADAAAELLRTTYPDLCEGTATRRPQDHAAATTFGGRRPADGQIEWQQGARKIRDLIRAVTHPYPGAFTWWDGRQLSVWDARTEREDGTSPPPGTVVALADGAVIVQAGRGLLRVTRLQLAGEVELAADPWAKAHGVKAGSVLG